MTERYVLWALALLVAAVSAISFVVFRFTAPARNRRRWPRPGGAGDERNR